MQQGAWGMSTGLQYVPGAYAKTDELIALAEVVGKHGGIYASHIRDEGDELIESIEEVIDIARGGNLPCHVSHFKASKKPNWGKVRAAARLIEEARSDGLQDHGRPVSVHRLVHFDHGHASARRRTRRRRTASPPKRLKDAEQVKRLRPIIADGLEARGEIMIASSDKKPKWVGKMIADIAAEEGREPVDIALELLARRARTPRASTSAWTKPTCATS